MRCMNCGWENPDSLQRCEKCNSPLSSSYVNSNIETSKPEGPVLQGTISEREVFADSNPSRDGNTNCPECGYPLRRWMEKCPNCGEEILNDSGNKQKEVMVNSSKHNSTINPWVSPVLVQSIRLEPVAWEKEKNVPAAQSFMGDSVELNRRNTDPMNNTITSKVQAVLLCENGVWTIEDKSSQGTTFIQAKRKIALEDGDIILMGNRKFVFKKEQ